MVRRSAGWRIRARGNSNTYAFFFYVTLVSCHRVQSVTAPRRATPLNFILAVEQFWLARCSSVTRVLSVTCVHLSDFISSELTEPFLSQSNHFASLSRRFHFCATLVPPKSGAPIGASAQLLYGVRATKNNELMMLPRGAHSFLYDWFINRNKRNRQRSQFESKIGFLGMYEGCEQSRDPRRNVLCSEQSYGY